MRTLKEITVEVTQKCNSNCIFCSSLSNKNSCNQIPLAKLKEISEFAVEKQADCINISGGEPLLYPDIKAYLQLNKALELKSVIYTSGNADVHGFIDELLNENINSNDVSFVFNYQSSVDSVFKKLTGSTDEFSVDVINKNIQYCIENGFGTEVHIVPNALNIATIYDTCVFLKNLGISKVSLLRLVYQGRAENNKSLLHFGSENNLSDIISKIQNELCDSSFNLRIGIPYSSIVSLKTPCYARLNKIIIKYDGKVYPCEAFKEAPQHENFILGDIYSDSLETIWNNDISQLKDLKNKLKHIATCETCPAQLLYE